MPKSTGTSIAYEKVCELHDKASISHFVAIRFTCFVFFVRTHVSSWVDRSYATTKLFYIDVCVFVFLFDV